MSEAEELRRVIPVIEKLAAIRWGERSREPRLGKSRPACGDARPTRKPLLSIDTMKPAVARAALQAGASIVNDVAASSRGRAGEGADEMWKIVAEFRAGYVVHARARPAADDAGTIRPTWMWSARSASFFRERLDALKATALPPEQVVLDPGIGFGKTPEHNLQLLAELTAFYTNCSVRCCSAFRASRSSGQLLGANRA